MENVVKKGKQNKICVDNLDTCLDVDLINAAERCNTRATIPDNLPSNTLVKGNITLTKTSPRDRPIIDSLHDQLRVTRTAKTIIESAQ